MRRVAQHRLLVVCLSIAFATGVFAQDFSKVEIKTTKLAGNLYTLEGQGGAIGVLTGPDGILMVDSQFAPLTERIVAAIKAIDPGPIRYLINTHVHGDHTGGNANLGAMGVTVIARPQLRARLEKPGPTATGAPGTPAPAAALPRLTYDAPMTFYMNGEQVQLIPIPAAHTDGDTLVFFRRTDVVSTGDVFTTTGYPVIRPEDGGSIDGVVAALNRIIEITVPEQKQEGGTLVIPGHGRLCDEADVVEYRDMVTILRDRIRSMVEKGMTLKQVQAAKPTADYDGRYGATTGRWTTEQFVAAAYESLKSNK
jgi:glyoxylase-like metal-dependent hydrolase (beta-lactamase superfamily II)